MTATKTLEDRLLAAAKKAGRDQDAVAAMRAYQAEKVRVDANTLRLRALRLAKEVADAQAAAAKPVAPKKASRRARSPAS